jgi:hypothetical protein
MFLGGHLIRVANFLLVHCITLFLDTNIVLNNNYLWKLKIPLKLKYFCGYYIEKQYSPKIT